MHCGNIAAVRCSTVERTRLGECTDKNIIQQTLRLCMREIGTTVLLQEPLLLPLALALLLLLGLLLQRAAGPFLAAAFGVGAGRRCSPAQHVLSDASVRKHKQGAKHAKMKQVLVRQVGALHDFQSCLADITLKQLVLNLWHRCQRCD